MKIGILGTGVVGQTIDGHLAQRDHEVMVGTRDVGETLARREPDPYGWPPFGERLRQYPAVQLAVFAEAARHGEVWKHVLDLGDITSTRGTEMYLPVGLAADVGRAGDGNVQYPGGPLSRRSR